jgi:putative membrane protein
MEWLIRLLITWAINVLALVVADWAFDSFEIERWWPVIWAGAILGLANAFLRPVVKTLALPLIIVTLGIAYFFVSMLMLLVTEWISPDLRIDGFWTYVGATIVVGLVNWLASAVVAPIVRPRGFRS